LLDDCQLVNVAHLWEQLTGKSLTRSAMERIAHQYRDPDLPFDIVRATYPLIPTINDKLR
jgi:hypothetical protein